VSAAPDLGSQLKALRGALDDRGRRWQQAQQDLDALDRARPAEVADAARTVEHYRLIASDLAIARKLAPDSRARAALEVIYARAHALVHRSAVDVPLALWSFFRDQLPATVSWLRPYIRWVSVLFLVAAVAGWLLITSQPELAPLLLNASAIEGVERGELWTDSLVGTVPPAVLSTDILSNNITVSLVAFCAGFLFGLGTFYVIGLNGLMLGGVFAFTTQHGVGGRLFEFVVAHGVVELSCIVLAGAAGAAVGESLIRPIETTRAASFAKAARRAGQPLIAVMVLLIGCGFIEGYISPDPAAPLWARLVIGFGYFVFMIALLRGWLFGRSRGTPEVRA
jgi:uncharacterized membrane protein SpoIIM required for sporulation